MADILIVDDERAVREGLAAVLEAEGHRVRLARNGARALAAFGEQPADLVLLDVMMPEMSGFAVCQELRKLDALVPIVFLTAKDSEADQVRGIGAGADDYLAKTVGEAVLLARIDRALARSGRFGEMLGSGGKSEGLWIGGVRVDADTLAAYDGERILGTLTRTEWSVLKLLGEARGRTFSMAEIIAGLRGVGFVCEDSLVYTHISNLRRKLGPAAAKLVTVHGLGYCLER